MQCSKHSKYMPNKIRKASITEALKNIINTKTYFNPISSSLSFIKLPSSATYAGEKSNLIPAVS